MADQLGMQMLPPADVAGTAWERNGEIVVTNRYKEAKDLSDSYAIEHVDVQKYEMIGFLSG